MSELVSQARQIGRFGTAEQIERTETILLDTIQNLYTVLATKADTDPGTDSEVDPQVDPEA